VSKPAPPAPALHTAIGPLTTNRPNSFLSTPSVTAKATIPLPPVTGNRLPVPSRLSTIDNLPSVPRPPPAYRPSAPVRTAFPPPPPPVQRGFWGGLFGGRPEPQRWLMADGRWFERRWDPRFGRWLEPRFFKYDYAPSVVYVEPATTQDDYDYDTSADTSADSDLPDGADVSGEDCFGSIFSKLEHLVTAPITEPIKLTGNVTGLSGLVHRSSSNQLPPPLPPPPPSINEPTSNAYSEYNPYYQNDIDAPRPPNHFLRRRPLMGYR